jgi:hypothetical protein
MSHSGPVQLYAYRPGDKRERRGEFPEPELHPIDREFGEQHRQRAFSEGFEECALLGRAQFNDPFGNLGIINDLVNVVRNIAWFPFELQLQIDSQRLRAPALFRSDAATPLKFKPFDNDPTSHVGIVQD